MSLFALKAAIHFRVGRQVLLSKAGKNTGLSQKNVFFLGADVFFSPALFARAMCGAGTSTEVFANICGISTTFFIGSESIRPIAHSQ
jgi:hypothetical protein